MYVQNLSKQSPTHNEYVVPISLGVIWAFHWYVGFVFYHRATLIMSHFVNIASLFLLHTAHWLTVLQENLHRKTPTLYHSLIFYYKKTELWREIDLIQNSTPHIILQDKALASIPISSLHSGINSHYINCVKELDLSILHLPSMQRPNITRVFCI